LKENGRVFPAIFFLRMIETMSEGERYTGAFFGRHKGKPLRAHQADLLQSLLPHLAIDLTAPPPDDLTGLFSATVSEVRLEIGFGGAEHLIAQALAHPEAGIIGVEPFVNGMAKALALIEQHNLQNIRLHQGDATDLLAWLPETALTRIDMLYPDPWPKRRHWKRRFINERSIAALARVLRRGAEFRFASDWPNYAAWTLRRMLQSPSFAWNAERADDWRKAWPGFSGTRYEAKAKREGRSPCYLTFVRT
jgi:tRNA (guanine-N7-)-methyltransferase